VLHDNVINNKKLVEAQVVCEGVAAAWECLKDGRGHLRRRSEAYEGHCQMYWNELKDCDKGCSMQKIVK
jgi:hypothetical protein